MRSIALVIACAVSSGGCTSKGMQITTLGALWIAGGAALAESTRGNNDAAEAGVAIAALASVVVIIGMVVGIDGFANPEKADHLIDAPAIAQATDPRQLAWQLMKSADVAAHVGDCSLVVTLDARVSKIDLDFDHAVFRRDPAINRCLTAMREACIPTCAAQ
jgi:hypothetical protein